MTLSEVPVSLHDKNLFLSWDQIKPVKVMVCTLLFAIMVLGPLACHSFYLLHSLTRFTYEPEGWVSLHSKKSKITLLHDNNDIKLVNFLFLVFGDICIKSHHWWRQKTGQYPRKCIETSSLSTAMPSFNATRVKGMVADSSKKTSRQRI